MFDLFRSRDKTVRILLSVILGLVAISMVTYLIPQGNSALTGGNDNTIARIGDETLTMQTVQQAVSATMKGQQLPPEVMSMYAPQVVHQLINERALAYEAKRLGIRVSDDEVSTAIRAQMPPQFIKPDGGINQDMLAQALERQGHTIAEYVEEVRRGMEIARLRQLATDGVVVTKTEVEQAFKQRNEKIKVEYVVIKPSMLEQQVQVTPAEVQDSYKKNVMLYQTPETRNAAIILLDSARIEQSINPPDTDLQSTYNASQDRFRTPERVKVRHILLMTDAKKKDDDQVRAKAEDVLKQVRSGGDFAALAKQFSQDTVSAAKGGELDFISRGQTVKPFEDSAFSLKPGETSNLVKTMYGYHILQVEAREDAHLKPFAEVKDVLATEYRKRKAGEMLQQLSDQAARELKKDPAHPEKAAEDVKGVLIMAGNLKPFDPIPQIGPSTELHSALNSLKKGEVSAPVAIPPSKSAVAVLTGITAAHASAFEDVKSQVEAALRKTKVDALVQQRATDLVAKSKSNGNDLAKTAKEMGFEVKTSTDVNRQGAVEGLGSASSLTGAFTAADGSIVGPVQAADGKAVCKVLSHTPADMATFATQQGAIHDELKSKLSRDRVALFDDGIVKRLEKDGKVKISQDNMNRMLQAMRG